MGKIFLFVFTIFYTSVNIHAQEKYSHSKKPGWGIKTGVNFSTLHSDQSSAMDPSWRTGFVAGAFFRISTGSRLMVQPEFLFSSMGANIKNAFNTTTRLNYFSIPVLLRYKLLKQLYVVAGPQFDLLVSAKTFHGMETADVSNDYKDHSINITGGFEFWRLPAVGICARYMHGITDITKGNGSVTHQGVQLTAAVRL